MTTAKDSINRLIKDCFTEDGIIETLKRERDCDVLASDDLKLLRWLKGLLLFAEHGLISLERLRKELGLGGS